MFRKERKMNLFRKEKELKEPTEIDEILGLIDAIPIEAIYPFVYKENKDCVEMGGNYIKIIAFASYPNEQKGNWLSDLKRMKGNITISQYIEQTDASIMLEHYNSSYKNKEAELLITHDPQYRIKLKKELKSAAYQLEEALNNKSGYVNIYTYILIQAQEQAELKSFEEKVQRILMKLHIKGIVPYYKMNAAYWSALPLKQNLLKEYTYQMSNTTAASSFFPFDDSEICDLSPKAQIEGINKKTNSLVAINYLDDKKTLNQNMFVIGTSGVGKTTYLKRKIINLIAQGKKIYIIDPENEYTNIVNYFGGTVIHLSSMSETIINPLEIYSEELTQDEIIQNAPQLSKIKNLIKQKCQRLKGFFKVIKSDMSQVEASIIESLVLKLYVKLENCRDFKSVTHEDFPILEDLYRACEIVKLQDPERFTIIRDFYYILESYVYGSNSLFNGSTNIDLSSELVSFDLSALQTEKDVQGACYLNIFSYLWDDITKVKTQESLLDNDYAAYMFIDEFHFLLKNQESCDFFFQAYKRFRKYKAGAIAATQQINDVLKANYSEGDLGTAVVENSYTKVFFGLDNKGVDDLIEKLKLSFSKPEISLLRAKRQGEALIIYGSKRVFMKIELTKEELRLCNPKRYAEKYEEDPTIQPDYEKELYISPLEIEEINNDDRGGQ
ncbi:MAG TPA: conjugal transfer protein [Desulfosporosinus sp.]|nr:conjugal transfer protein [Desulfosporosinus sp.]